ncbi:MAG: hypothetical protein WB677_25880, partial [Xanthobacteraceae bacterium]
MQDIRISPQRIRIAGEANTTTFHDVGMMGNAQSDMSELLDKQHADSAGGERFQHRHEPRDDDRRKTEGKLVGQDLARPADDRLTKHQH